MAKLTAKQQKFVDEYLIIRKQSTQTPMQINY